MMGKIQRIYKSSLYTPIIAIALVLALIAGLGCNIVAAEAAVAAPHVTVTMDDDNSLIMHLEGSVKAPGRVMIQYWSTGNGPFVVGPIPTRGIAFSTKVMRLRANTKYNFNVYLLDSANKPDLQYQGNFTTGPLPAGLKGDQFEHILGNPTYDLVLLDHNDKDFSGIVAIDRDSQIVWYYQHDRQVFTFAQTENHDLVFNELGMVLGYAMNEITPDGRIVRSIDDKFANGIVCEPYGRWHHEMILRPDNKVWTLGSEIRSVNINGQDTLQSGSTIEEWDLTRGTVTRLVSLFDLLDPVKDRGTDSNTTTGFFWTGRQGQYSGEAEDWTHSNSLDVLPDGTVLMSIRHLDQIIAIKPDFSGIAWKLGGQGSDFTFPDPTDKFYHQHYVNMLPNGHILLFDNGNFRPKEEGGQYSRALELELDMNTMQARKVWEYRSQPDLFAGAVGSVVRMSNGNTLIDFGFDDVDKSPIFTLVEADAKGNAVAITRIASEGKTIQYRAIPIDSINGETRGSVLPGQ